MTLQEQVSALRQAIMIDQALLRSTLFAVLKAAGPDQGKRLALEAQQFIDRYYVPGTDDALLEPARERARRNVDELFSASLAS